MNIAFYYNGLPIDGLSPMRRPLGGSESSLIYAARELQALGNSVTVYANCPAPGLFEGVDYRHYHRFFEEYPSLPWDVIVAFRSFDPLLLGRVAPKMIFWTGDAHDAPLMAHFGHTQLQKNLDLTWCVSEWQRRKFIETFGLKPDKVVATRNGYAPFLLKTPETERRWRDAAYTSTPFRGLDILLKIFPEMRRHVPDLRLKVWSSMKVYNWSEEQDRRVYGSLYEATAQPGVSWHAGVAQPELLKHLGTCGLLLYPNTYEETSCIAAIEAQASGMVVVTTARAALIETVQHNTTGLCLEGDPATDDYQRRFIAAVTGLLHNPDRLQTMSEAARARALKNYSWSSIAREWISILAAMPAEHVPRSWDGPLLTLPDATAADLADYACLLQTYGIRYPGGKGNV